MGKCTALVILFLGLNHLSDSRPVAEQEKHSITLTFVGDVMLARGVGRKMLENGIDYPFAKVKPILKNSDICFGNLEGCLVGNTVTGSSKAFIFRSPPRFGQALRNVGFDVMSLANNHMFDGGRQGVVSTIETLENLAITPVGAGRNRSEARQPRFFEANGWKVAFFAYCDVFNVPGSAATFNLPGVATVEPIAEMVEDIKAAKVQADLVVVSYHWGREYQIGKPNQRQQLIAAKAKQAGADIVVGHHPHVLQALEIDKDWKVVAYSLGNFVFDNHKPTRARTVILQITIEPNGGKTINLLACQIIACQPRRISIGLPK
ncbi:MAG: CapA family protein [Patescibacteria group bacterium]